MDFNAHRSELGRHGRTYLAGLPYVYHCHHFNLFHDQSIEDALGEEEAIALKTSAAREAFAPMLAGLCEAQGAATPAERLQLAGALFPWMGQGRVEVLGDPSGGSARGEFLHYSFAWREKYGARVRRLDPLDGVAAGFVAAAVEVAYDRPFASIAATETQCYGLREPFCRFELSAREGGTEPPPRIDRATEAGHVAAPFTGQDEDRISQITAGLREFLTGVAGDERGLVPAFNVFVAMHQPTYYNRTGYETLRRLEQTSPTAVPAAEALLGESGHVCVFYTFGNILLSAEWEALVGPLSGEVPDTIAYCCALARALGFGHWTIGELDPGKRLVLRTPSNYEAPFYLANWGRSQKPRCLFLANSARAMMQLAHRVDLASKPQLTEELYLSLFRSGTQWHMEETRCVARGDEMCEVVVSEG